MKTICVCIHLWGNKQERELDNVFINMLFIAGFFILNTSLTIMVRGMEHNLTDHDRRGQKNKNKKHCSKMSTALQGLWLTEREMEHNINK